MAQRARTSEVETMLALKPDRSELDQALSGVSSRLGTDLARAATELRTLVDDRVSGAAHEVGALASAVAAKADRAEVEAALNLKCDTREVELWLQTKAGLEEVSAQLEVRESETGRALEGLVSKAELSRACDALDGRIGALQQQVAAEIARAVAPLANSSEVQSVVQQLVGKSTLDTALHSLDKKANVDDINRSLTEVNRELAQRPTLAELNRVIGEQSLIMESLCSEHLLGRWIWKSGRAKGEKNAVPWNVQNINTNPENFLWEKDRCAITTVAPGLYEVTFGFFTRKKPQVCDAHTPARALASMHLHAPPCTSMHLHAAHAPPCTSMQPMQPMRHASCRTPPCARPAISPVSRPCDLAPSLSHAYAPCTKCMCTPPHRPLRACSQVQLLVNGEPVLSAVSSASYAVHHSSGRLAAVGPHPAGNVTGLTLIDYLALPPKARVSISYQGEEGGEGFMGLRKM